VSRFTEVDEFVKTAGAKHELAKGVGELAISRSGASAKGPLSSIWRWFTRTPASAKAETEALRQAAKMEGVAGQIHTGVAPGDIQALSAKALEALVPEVKAAPLWQKGLAGAGLLGLGGAATTGVLGAMGGGAPADTLSYRINRGLHSLTDRINADEAFAGAFAKGLGQNAANSLSALATDMVGKGYSTMKDTLALSPVRSKIFNVLKKEDEIIGSADNKTLMEAYHTMRQVAPNLATDKNAVKSVLRMAATSGGGLDYNTIKGIADAEASVMKVKPGGTR